MAPGHNVKPSLERGEGMNIAIAEKMLKLVSEFNTLSSPFIQQRLLFSRMIDDWKASHK